MDALNDDRTIDINLRLPLRRMRDILTTAIESGIGYWAHDEDFVGVTYKRDTEGLVYVIELIRTEGAKTPKFRREVAAGARKAVLTDVDLGVIFGHAIMNPDTRHAAMAELTERDFDATTADTLVQFAFFGEVIYG